jgi:hypothetical protein
MSVSAVFAARTALLPLPFPAPPAPPAPFSSSTRGRLLPLPFKAPQTTPIAAAAAPAPAAEGSASSSLMQQPWLKSSLQPSTSRRSWLPMDASGWLLPPPGAGDRTAEAVLFTSASELVCRMNEDSLARTSAGGGGGACCDAGACCDSRRLLLLPLLLPPLWESTRAGFGLADVCALLKTGVGAPLPSGYVNLASLRRLASTIAGPELQAAPAKDLQLSPHCERV